MCELTIEKYNELHDEKLLPNHHDMVKDLYIHVPSITHSDRVTRNNYNPCVIWLTGLSGSGKSTLANYVEDYLHSSGISSYILDGDSVRLGLCKDLTFSDDDRTENIRRVAEVSKLMLDAGIVVIVSLISPFAADRNIARNIIGEKFNEIYMDCSLTVCEGRDPKGLYKKARNGDIKFFTGIDSGYDVPICSEYVIDTASLTITESGNKLIDFVSKKLLTTRKTSL
jgi:adenylylsulfate kinase